jgi:hypothetical protein
MDFPPFANSPRSLANNFRIDSAAGLRGAGEHPDALGDRAAHRKHDRADGDGGQCQPLSRGRGHCLRASIVCGLENFVASAARFPPAGLEALLASKKGERAQVHFVSMQGARASSRRCFARCWPHETEDRRSPTVPVSRSRSNGCWIRRGSGNGEMDDVFYRIAGPLDVPSVPTRGVRPPSECTE